MERVISLCGIPRSSSRVLIWPWNSRLQGCLRTDTKCSFRFFLTLLTCDLARVGGRFAAKGETYKQSDINHWKEGNWWWTGRDIFNNHESFKKKIFLPNLFFLNSVLCESLTV